MSRGPGGDLAALLARVVELERRVENQVRMGKVTDVDAGKQLVRLEIGADGDGTPQKGPWVPYAQVAGALKIHTPPSVGQNMMMIAPSGDIEQAVAHPYGWSNANPSPGEKGDEHVITFGGFHATLRGDELEIKIPRLSITAGGSTFDLSGDGLKLVAKLDVTGDTKISGETLKHNDLNVGSTHVHGGISPGGSDTKTPH